MTKARTLADNYAADINQVTASAPLTGGGTSGTVTVGIQAGTTAQSGAVQLTDSTASTSTTTAATPNSVKSAYDLANGAIAKSTVDAKGDLLVGTANDTVGRLAVASTAGYVLTVDSAETTGLKWAAAASGSTFAGCQLYMSSDQGISNNTATTLLFGSENFDTDGYHSTSSNTGRITIPTGKGGYYLLFGIVKWNGNTSQRRYWSLSKNGTFITGTDWLDSPGGSEGFVSQTYAYIVNATAGDYFETRVNQGSGGTLNVQSDGTYFGAYLLGA